MLRLMRALKSALHPFPTQLFPEGIGRLLLFLAPTGSLELANQQVFQRTLAPDIISACFCFISAATHFDLK